MKICHLEPIHEEWNGHAENAEKESYSEKQMKICSPTLIRANSRKVQVAAGRLKKTSSSLGKTPPAFLSHANGSASQEPEEELTPNGRSLSQTGGNPKLVISLFSLIPWADTKNNHDKFLGA